MPVVRLYLPLRRDDLVELDQRRQLPDPLTGPRPAYRVTPELQRAEPDLDLEGLEYAAFCEAVGAAAAMRPTAPRLVVAAADVEPAWLVAVETDAIPGPRCVVGLTQGLPLTRIASFHVGDETSAGDDQPDTTDLLWYDVTELQQVLGLFG